MISLYSLPTEILILILHQLLLVQDLSALARTSRFFHAVVNDFGWAVYRRNNPRPSMSLLKSQTSGWTAKDSAKYDVLADKSWSQFEFIARPLASPWAGKEQPILAINPSRLVIGAGSSIYSYTFGTSTNHDAPPVVLEGSCVLTTQRDRRSCITALTFIPDGGLDQTLCVGFQDGTFERIIISGRSKRQTTANLRVQRSTAQPLQLPSKDLLESLSSSRSSLLSLSAGGRATFTDIAIPSAVTSTVELGTRSWVSHLSMESTSPYAAFGTSSVTPLTIHPITNDRLAQIPSAVLGQAASVSNGSAVYGICGGPPSSLWGSSPEVVVSGWYNGSVSIHDLRSSSRGCAPETTPHSPTPLRPVLTLVNSWSIEPIYSVSSGGGSGSYVAAGWARHSLVSMWDVRSPVGGLSLHAPLNDPSPVYSLFLESSRLFGVTQSRPFVLDFGPGITETTYPDLGFSSRGFSHFNQKGADGFGYYVTKYLHRPTRVES